MKCMDIQGVLGVPESLPVMPEVRNLWSRWSEVSNSSKVLHIYLLFGVGVPVLTLPSLRIPAVC